MNPSNPKQAADAQSWFSSTASIPASYVGVDMENVGGTSSMPRFILTSLLIITFSRSASNPLPNNESPQQNGSNISTTILKLLTELRGRLRPWSEFFRFSKFALPSGYYAYFVIS